jgi:hypothetical protein
MADERHDGIDAVGLDAVGIDAVGLDAVDLDQLARYAGGELDARAAQELEARAASSPMLAAELALARAFREADSKAAGVDEIGARLAGSRPRENVVPFDLGNRRNTRTSGHVAAPWGRTLRLAAMLAVVIGGGVLVGRLTAPPVLPPAPTNAVRGSSLELVRPQGAVETLPAEVAWQPLPGLATRVWIESGSGELLLDQRVPAGVGTLALPPALVDRLAGGLRWRWAAEAIDGEGRVVARAEPVEVRLERAP